MNFWNSIWEVEMIRNGKRLILSPWWYLAPPLLLVLMAYCFINPNSRTYLNVQLYPASADAHLDRGCYYMVVVADAQGLGALFHTYKPEFEAMKHEFAQARRLVAPSAEAHHKLAARLDECAQPDLAEAEHRIAVHMAPGNPRYLKALAEILKRNRKYKAASEIYKKLLGGPVKGSTRSMGRVQYDKKN